MMPLAIPLVIFGAAATGDGESSALKLEAAVALLVVAVLIVVVLQLWLLTATMNAYLAHQEGVIIPAAIASIVCLALNVGLLSYIYKMERR